MAAKVKIEKPLYERLASAAKAGYATMDEFVIHVLERATSAIEEASNEEEVEKQLRGLGYIE